MKKKPRYTGVLQPGVITLRMIEPTYIQVVFEENVKAAQKRLTKVEEVGEVRI